MGFPKVGYNWMTKQVMRENSFSSLIHVDGIKELATDHIANHNEIVGPDNVCPLVMFVIIKE